MQRTPSFFEGVSTDAVEAVLADFARRDFDAGAVILAEGDYRAEMYVLSAGSADVVLVDRKRRRERREQHPSRRDDR